MKEVVDLLPYEAPFKFVDKLTVLTDNTVEGTYFFDEKSDFYQGHFKGNPITPGVLLTECMAQIGLVSLGIHLLLAQDEHALKTENLTVAFTEARVQFLKPVLPNTNVQVKSERLFWRLGKLKCLVYMYDEVEDLVAKGELSGMIRFNK